MRWNRLPFMMVAVVAASCLVASAADKVTLKINLPKGAAYKMSTGMDMTTKVKVGDQNIEVPMNMGMDIDMSVENTDQDGSQTFKTTYSAVRMKMGGPVSMEYDSAKAGDANNPIAKIMGALIGGTLQVKLGPDGKVKDVQGADELVKKMADAMKGLPGADAMGKSQVDQIKGQFDQMSAWLPKEPVGVGDSWDVKMEMASDPNMPMTVEGKCKLTDRKNGLAIIDMDGKITSKAGLNGTMSGKIGVDEKTGWAMSTDMDLKMAGNTMGQQIEVNGKVTQKTTSK